MTCAESGPARSMQLELSLLRIYGEAIGVSPRFTVHDRSDSEDLIGTLLDRHIKKTSISGMPKKGTALSIYSFMVNSQKPLAQF